MSKLAFIYYDYRQVIPLRLSLCSHVLCGEKWIHIGAYCY